jgi:hypothetical protein
MTLSTPWRNPLAYDQPIIGGRKWFGVAKVEGCERATELQKNKGKGSDGATVNMLGDDLAEPSITFTLWEGWDEAGNWVNYFAAWDEYQSIFAPPKDRKNPVALTIEHPVFELAGIKAVLVKKVGTLTLDRATGVGTVKVEFMEYRKPKPSLGTPKSASDVKGGSGQKPKTWVDIQNEHEAAELEKDTQKFKEALNADPAPSNFGGSFF